MTNRVGPRSQAPDTPANPRPRGPGVETIPVRDARDRVSELLGLGEPYPLRDLPVPPQGRTVPVGQPAKIPVELSQLGVTYALHDVRGNEVISDSNGATEPVKEEGTGETIHLPTPAITESVTYKIHAEKKRSKRKAYLHEFATITVGLDVTLTAWIRSHPPLDPTLDAPMPEDPRVAAYGDSIEVEVAFSQEGVDYRMVEIAREGDSERHIEISVEDVRGTGGNIVLQSKEMRDNAIVRVRAARGSGASGGEDGKAKLLNARLPLAVKANPELVVALSPGPIAAFGAEAAVRILETQAKAQYRLHLHRIADPEYVHDPAPDEEVVRVQVDGEPEVQVERPDLHEPWATVEGFDPQGEYVDGNGGELQIPVAQLEDDCMLIVEARKIHDFTQERADDPDGPGDTDSPAIVIRPMPSSVWLRQPALLLRRPDPAPPLSLSVTMQGAKTDGLMRVSGGRPGVYYHFRTAAGGGELRWPAYFHKRDAHDPDVNQGLGQLEIDIDLAIATDPPASVGGQLLEPARRPPQAPLLDTGQLASNTRLYVTARKAQSGIQAPVDRRARIVALPKIGPESPAVAVGAKAKIVVKASREGQSYQLARDGEPLGTALAGDGQDHVFETDAIVADTVFEVWVTRPGDADIPVRQSVPVPVLTLPDATLEVTVSATEVDRGDTVIIRVHKSQLDVLYQLVAGTTPVGEATAGNGADLQLPTGPIETDSTFKVRASKAADRAVFVDLDKEVSITVRPVT